MHGKGSLRAGWNDSQPRAGLAGTSSGAANIWKAGARRGLPFDYNLMEDAAPPRYAARSMAMGTYGAQAR